MREGSGTQSIHIVDDDEAVRDSLAALVESAGLSAKVYASAIELLTSPGGLAADCLVADIRMPEMDGLELQQELKRRGMTMPLILITGHADVGLAVQAMKAGASDFLEKPFEGERLLASITEALEQGARKPRANAEPNLAADRLAALTGREREIVDRLVAGLSNKEIARELGISYQRLRSTGLGLWTRPRLVAFHSWCAWLLRRIIRPRIKRHLVTYRRTSETGIAGSSAKFHARTTLPRQWTTRLTPHSGSVAICCLSSVSRTT